MNFKIPYGTIENFVFSNFNEARKTSKGEFHFNSPFVRDGKLRYYVNPENNKCFDQKQQKGNSFTSFVAEYLEVSQKEAVILLIKDYGTNEVDNVKYEKVLQVQGELEIPIGLKWFFEDEKKGRTYKLAKRYLNSRMISEDDLGYIYDPNGDFKKTYHNRIFVPFYEESKLVYFIARSFDNSLLRYKNPKGVDAGNFVFQVDKLEDDVFIFEGVFDALSLNPPQVGTAMLSNKLKQVQITKILDRAPKRVIFVTENDTKQIAIEAGKRNLEWNLKEMMKYKAPSQNIEFYIFNPPLPYKDFSEYSVKTNTHNIDINECEKWRPNKFEVNDLKWGYRNTKI